MVLGRGAVNYEQGARVCVVPAAHCLPVGVQLAFWAVRGSWGGGIAVAAPGRNHAEPLLNHTVLAHAAFLRAWPGRHEGRGDSGANGVRRDPRVQEVHMRCGESSKILSSGVLSWKATPQFDYT